MGKNSNSLCSQGLVIQQENLATGGRRQARRRDPESRDPAGGAPGSASESSRTATARGEGDGAGGTRASRDGAPHRAPTARGRSGGQLSRRRVWTGTRSAELKAENRTARAVPAARRAETERCPRCFGGRAARLGRAEARENSGVKNGAKGRQQPRQGATGRSSGCEAARAAERSQREAAGTVRSGWCAHWMPRGGRSSRGAERRRQTGAPPLGTGEPTGPRGQEETRPGDRIRGPEGH